jgi:hypothetical protein
MHNVMNEIKLCDILFIQTFTLIHPKIIIVYVYKSHSHLVFIFLNNIQTIIQCCLKHFLITILGDCNVNILKHNNHAKKIRTIKFHG